MKNANVPVWTSFLLGYGVDPVDAKGNLMTDSPEAIEAAKLYQRLLTKAAPQGVAGFNWSECQSAFLQGKVGMWLDGVGFAPPLEDPEKSRIVGKVGYGVMPKGPKAQASATFGDGIGVTSASKNKEAAYLYCQWAISKLMGGRLLQAGGGVPFRHSILNDAEVRKGVKMPAGLDRRGGRIRQDQPARTARRPAGDRVPRHHRHRPDEPDRRRRSGDGAEEGDRAVQADPRAQREGLTARRERIEMR